MVPPYLVPEAALSSWNASDDPYASEAFRSVESAAWSCQADGHLPQDAALAALNGWGCALLQGAVSRTDIAHLREALGLVGGSSKFRQDAGQARRAGEVGQWLLQKDPNIAMGRYTFGRLHCLLRGSPVFEPFALSIHAAVAPAVHTFFGQAVASGGRVFLSEAQLIVADSCAEQQAWHLDNGGRGLTVMVPLVDVPADRGPQAVLPGTHALHEAALTYRQRLRLCLSALSSSHGSTSPAVANTDALGRTSKMWAAGDALLLDSRALHRALPNDSLGAPMSMLLLRYDLLDTPPPGLGRLSLLSARVLGAGMNGFFKFYAAV
eukprot:TRINITY_DN23164_c0_g1_i1.p1 TRINITY_DN23164_c0_g1~~TRINITY_DN23164_c0_g1_i1.p1  ORF type:complete len:322 (-),score=32.87 TRINITY_DN23164_c0_g1_i1:218-1183(-)